ncbi:hypothetical protein Emag_004123 [Eimeria magna]
MEDAPEAKTRETSEGTPAFYRLNGGAKPDCSAAVKDWQEGFSIFERSPPVEQDGTYSDLAGKGISFVALYNPSDDIKGGCQVILCKEKTGSVQSPSQRQVAEEKEAGLHAHEGTDDDVGKEDPSKGHESETAPQPPLEPAPGPPAPEAGGDDGAEGKMASALLCLTSPEALDNNPLEQQWDKIVKALSNSASVAVTSFLAFVAVVSGAFLL